MTRNSSVKLLLMAHPDDEVIFGWPFWGSVTHILFCSDDSQNQARQQQERVLAYREVAQALGAVAVSIPQDCEFYRLPTRYATYTLRDFIKQVSEAVEKLQPDAIYTHNSIGEYGHLDHQLVHRIALQVGRRLGLEVFMTDIFLESNWHPYTRYRPEGRKLGDVSLNMGRYEEIQHLYQKHNAWTWDQPPVRRAGIYVL